MTRGSALNSHRRRRVLAPAALLAGLCAAAFVSPAWSQTTGTFVDRFAPTDVRVVSYNVYNDSNFADFNAIQAAKFARVMAAIDPDVINLQEVYSHSAAQTAALMNSILPLGGGATWHAHKAFDNIIVSKYPLSLTATNTSPASPRNIAIALVDLPDELYATDFYFMNNHYRCCGTPTGPEVAERQLQSDALVNWMRDARSPGGVVTLASGTPMAVVGDLNMVESLEPLTNLLAGNIVNEDTYGSDSPPDWDGGPLTDAHPLQNGVGPASYTWRDDNQIFAPGRLDFIIYTGSVARAANQFVLNTVAMSAAELAATGLQTYDVALSPSTYDHLPVVVDSRFVADGPPGDFNLDRTVNDHDYDLWRTTFGASSLPHADANGDHAVNAADYVIWRKSLSLNSSGASGGAAESVPEPASYLLCVAACGALAVRWRNRPPLRRRISIQGAGHEQTGNDRRAE